MTVFICRKRLWKLRLAGVDLEDGSRVVAVRAAKDFLNEWERTNVLPTKGLYIHGKFGVGKSYLLGALANELAARHIHSVVVYVPEFLREMKQAIQDHSLAEKIEFVKRAPVLMLDDIGAEIMSSWTRDEILGQFCIIECQNNYQLLCLLISIMMNYSIIYHSPNAGKRK